MNARLWWGPLHSRAARSTGGTATVGCACAQNEWRVGKRTEAPSRLPGPGTRKIASQWETSDVLHLSQGFKETSLFAQQLCSLPPPSAAPSGEGQSQLWQGNGVPKEKLLHPAVTKDGGQEARLSSVASEGNCYFVGSQALYERLQVSGTRPVPWP